jgi:NAD(P)-dependent dehydrogenase (short-subunit alcohol dehydrogenase family)
MILSNWREKQLLLQEEIQESGKILFVFHCDIVFFGHLPHSCHSFATAFKLAKLGKSKIIIACRNREKAEAAVKSLIDESGNESIEYRLLDLCSLQSVAQFAKDWNGEKIDILINNAAIMAVPFRLSDDGIESQLATNHFGHFLLTVKLLDCLKKSEAPRVVNVSSSGHFSASAPNRWALDWLNDEKGYDCWAAYCLSKLANVLFSDELARRFDWLFVGAVHPGFVATNLQANIGLSCDDISAVSGLPAITPDKGALCSIYVAAAVGIENAKYWEHCEVVAPNAHVTAANADALWRFTEQVLRQKQLLD